MLDDGAPEIHNNTMHEELGPEGNFCGPIINHENRDLRRQVNMLADALREIEWSNDPEWQSDRAKLALSIFYWG